MMRDQLSVPRWSPGATTQAGLGRPGPGEQPTLSGALPLAGFETGSPNGWGP